jgi:hypothetical protein
MPVGRIHRSPEELARALFTLGIELLPCIELLELHAARGWDLVPEGISLTLLRSAMDAGLIRARSLIEFFVGRPTRSGGRARNPLDVTPRDFCPTFELEPDLVARFDDALAVLDKELAHLSWERVTGPSGVHDFSRLTDDLLVALLAFAARVEEQGYYPQIGARLRSLWQELTDVQEVTRAERTKPMDLRMRRGRIEFSSDGNDPSAG